MSDSTKITENLLTAVDIIVEEKLRVLDFDRTEQYTIVDNSKADSSIYTISDGSVSFEAYALTNVDKYKVGDIVIVSIPKSDFSNPEKTILRLATKSDNDETGRISRPFDQIVDVSGNLISQAGASRTFGLAANFYQDSKLNSQSDFKIGDKQFQVTDNDEIGQPQLIRIIDITDESILRYTNTCPYIGLSAKFTAPLGQGMQRVISGDYGIKLSLYLDGQNDIPGQTGYITNEDMFGDSYNYVAGVTEQKVMYFQFNRTERSQPEHQITRITIDFFQGGNFINYQGDFYNLISDDSGDPAFATKTDESIVDNLFVSELYLCSAFDKKDYVANKVEISSNHSVIYNQNGDNTAKINVSWLYCGDDIPRLVFEKPKNNIRVRWYAYAVGQPGDKYGGIDWSLIKETEDFEASIVLPTNISQYEIKAIIIDTDNFYTSYNTLIFLNYNYIELYKPEYDTKLVYSDQTNGLYPWYNLLDELIDSMHSYEDRTIHPAFLDGATLGPEIISQMKWIVPDPQYGMLDYQNDEAITGMLSNEYIKTYSDNSTITYIKNVDDRTYTIIAVGTLAIQEMFNLKYHIKSKIEYSPIAHIVCEIQVAKATGSLADKPHIATTDMQFLQESTSGSLYSLIIRSKNNEILTYYSGDTSNLDVAYSAAEEEGLHSINLEVFMIGKDNELIKFDGNISQDGRYGLNFQWKTIKNLNGGLFYPTEVTENNEQTLLILNSDTGLISLPSIRTDDIIMNNNYYIVQVTVSPRQQEDTWQRNIIGYFAVPIRYNQKITNLTGTSSIIYNSDGLLKTSDNSFYPFILEVDKDSSYKPSKYELSYFDNNQDQDIILQNNLLQAPHFYLESFENIGICIKAKTSADILLWSQPIIITQQAWASSLINKWDGKLKIDEENNYILTAMLGAGTKNSNNQFSGVLLGNIAEVDKNTEQSIRENTGIYGFRDGVQVYAFKDDGTAFIGSNSGRLNFDGNNARIYNSAMVNSQNQQLIVNGKGLLIDFDDALIHTSNIYKGEDGAENPRQRHVYINGFDSKYPFAIGDITYNKNNNSVGGNINVSNANFYIDWDGNLKLSGSITPTGKALKSINDIIGNTENYRLLTNSIGDLQIQLDNEIDIYTGIEDPPTKNSIYGNISDDELVKKKEDLYYNTVTNKIYRFDGIKWIEDPNVSNATIEALKNASKAEDMADGKRRIIYSKTAPTTTQYSLDIGDLWVDGKDIKVWDGSEWINADNYKQTAANELNKLATGKYTYTPVNLDTYFIDKNTIYSPRIFGGATLGIGYNQNNQSYTAITAAVSSASSSSYVLLGNDITKPSRWLLNDDYNFRVYPTGGIGIGPISLSENDTTNARYNFMVDNKGNIFANNGKFKGEITASSGKIGNWEVIAKDTGSSTTPSIPNGSLCFDVSNIGQDGTIALIPSGYLYKPGTTWTQKELTVAGHSTAWWRLVVGSRFGVDYYGNLYANNGSFSGNISSSHITGSTITTGANFSVDSNGNLTAINGNFKGNIDLLSSTLKGGTGDTAGGVTVGYGNNGTTNTRGAIMYAGDNPPGGAGDGNYIIATSGGARMTSQASTDAASIYAAGTTCKMETKDTSDQYKTSRVVINPDIGFEYFRSWDDETSLAVRFQNGQIQLVHSKMGSTYMSAGSSSLSTSDIRLKKNIIDFSNEKSLDFITSLEPFVYQYKKNNDRFLIGFSAQEVQAYYNLFFPELEDKNLLTEKDNNGYYLLSMGALIPYITKSITVLKEKNDILKNQIEILQSELSDLKLLLREKGVI